MIKRLLSVGTTLTMGVILGFGILILSEQRSTSFVRSQLDESRLHAKIVRSERTQIAELKAEIARLEATAARSDRSARDSNDSDEAAVRALPPRAVALPTPTGDTPVRIPVRRDEGLSSAHAAQTPPSPAETGFLPAPPGYDRHAIIEGTVVADATSKPVAAFTLGVKKADTEWSNKEIRDAKGQFKWVLDPGQASVFVHAPGYADWLKTDVDLLAGTVTRITIRLVPDGRFQGRVVDAETLRPVARAILSLPGANAGKSTWKLTTDSNGRFTGRNPFALGTPRRVKITHRDYATLLADVSTNRPGAFRLQRGAAVLIGRAKTADGKPVYGARIRVIRDDPDRPEVKTVTSDLEGGFKVGGLTPGRFLVWANARRFPAAVRVVDLGPGETDLTEFVFRKGFTLPGRLVREPNHDTPLIIQVYDASGGFLMEVPVSRDNSFQLENLGSGEYTLKVHENGSSMTLKSFVIRVPMPDEKLTLAM